MKTIDLQKTFKGDIQKKLSEEFGNSNIHTVPKLIKIVLNTGVGKIFNVRRGSASDKKSDEELLSDLIEGIALISGQRPHMIRARHSIAGFKLREGMVVGIKVTLRRKKMYDFLSRLIHISLPRTRDFRGILIKSIDNSGNLSIGIKDSSIFPELPNSNVSWGLEITLVTDSNDRDKNIELYKKLGIPLKTRN